MLLARSQELLSNTPINSRTTTSQKCEAVPGRARIEGSLTFVSLNSRLDSEKEEEEDAAFSSPVAYEIISQFWLAVGAIFYYESSHLAVGGKAADLISHNVLIKWF